MSSQGSHSAVEDTGSVSMPPPQRIGGMARSVISSTWAAIDQKQRKRADAEAMIREHPMLPAAEATLAVTLCKTGLDRSEAERKELLESHSYADSRPTFNRTDLGNAERLKCWHGEDLRYVPEWKSWVWWNGKRWERDTDGEIRRKAKLVVRQIYRNAGDIEDESDRKAVVKYALQSESNQRIRAMIESAQAELPVTPDVFDADPFLFNAANGCVDLGTGDLREHRRGDMLMKASPVVYRDDMFAKCERWLAFLDRIMGGNVEMIEALQRCVGYSLTGDVSEQVMFILYGTGANGKSTFIETIKVLLGDYAASAQFSSFVAGRGDSESDKPRSDLARLVGARFVSASEGETGSRLSESWIKQMTGGDTVTVRRLHELPFEFKPQFKLWLSTNHKPEIKGTDLAIWRRIRLIPFEVTIPVEEQDRTLAQRLRKELPGILAWAVQGCLDWQKHGLAMPEKVTAATEDYREEQDILGDWFSERAELDPDAEETAAELYRSYTNWVEEQGGGKPISRRAVGDRLRERGLMNRKAHGGRKRWIGIRLRGGS